MSGSTRYRLITPTMFYIIVLDQIFDTQIKGLNASVGIAAQQLQLKGNYSVQKNLPDLQRPVNKTYSNLVPNANLGCQLFKTTYLNFSYSFNVNEPTISELMPITSVNNIAYRIEGNPDLQPERKHSFNLTSNYSNQASMSSLLWVQPMITMLTRIVYNQTILNIPNVGLQTVSRPDNMKGGDNFTLYAGTNYPLIKTKLTMNINCNLNFSSSPTLINDVKNITKNNGYMFATSFNLNVNEKIVLGTNGSINFK